jgi:hypothetical protein
MLLCNGCCLQDKLSKAHVLEELTSKWQLAPGITLATQFGWLSELTAAPAMTPPAASAPLQQQLEFMLLGWKQARCMSPLRHAFERCPGYHVVQVCARFPAPDDAFHAQSCSAQECRGDALVAQTDVCWRLA